MKKSCWWYVLFVKTNTEHLSIVDIQKTFERMNIANYELEAFVFETERFYRNKQFQNENGCYKKKLLFPGYVFVETNMPSKVFRETFFQHIKYSANIIRLLNYGSPDQIAISVEERTRLNYFLLGSRCLNHSIGYIVGDKIVVQDGPLVGHENEIIKINRHNREATVEIKIFDKKIQVKMALEIKTKTND